MYVIGIDISKYKHDCAILDEDTGTIVRDVFSFDNNPLFKNVIEGIVKKIQLCELNPSFFYIVFYSIG